MYALKELQSEANVKLELIKNEPKKCTFLSPDIAKCFDEFYIKPMQTWSTAHNLSLSTSQWVLIKPILPKYKNILYISELFILLIYNRLLRVSCGALWEYINFL